jgi:hypothetical protein
MHSHHTDENCIPLLPGSVVIFGMHKLDIQSFVVGMTLTPNWQADDLEERFFLISTTHNPTLKFNLIF